MNWDDIGTNPHEESIEKGRTEGRAAGLVAGYQQGYDLGQSLALEYGLELGFIRGIVLSIMKHAEFCQTERAQKTAQEVMELVHGFPGPHQVFQEQEQERQRALHVVDDDDAAKDTPKNDDTKTTMKNTNTTTSSHDTSVLMQQIRAKFKLLTMQANCGPERLSLKQLMEDAMAKQQSAVASNEVSEW
jgi:hypothetical protein